MNKMNWKPDETYAPASEKTGVTEILDVGADAQVVPGRGVIVTTGLSA